MRLLIGIIGFVAMLLMTACGDGALNNPYPETDLHEKVIYSSFEEQPKHLDPARSYSSAEAVFTGAVYEPPLQYSYLKKPYVLEPLTLTEMPQVSRFTDSTGAPRVRYQLSLRTDIRFAKHPAFVIEDDAYVYHHLKPQAIGSLRRLSDFPKSDSRLLTAGDYIYQIKRMADPQVNSPIYSLLKDYILGFEEAGKAIADWRKAHKGEFLDLRSISMAGLKIIDDSHFEIILKKPYPQFKYWLAMPFFSPMAWEVDRFYAQPALKKRNITLDWFPAGTGPFILAENDPNRRMMLVRNPNYHDDFYPTEGSQADREAGLLDRAGQKMPFVDRIEFHLEKENIPYWNKFLQGYYDRSGIASDVFDQAITIDETDEAGVSDILAERGVWLTSSVSPSLFYWGFNMKDDLLGGNSERARLLRRAISIALNVEEYIAIFTNGRGIPAQGMIPPGIFGYDETDFNPYVYRSGGLHPKRKSIKAAKKLLETAGYKNGIDPKTNKPLAINLDVPSSASPDTKSQYDWIRKQFAKLNIQLTIRDTQYSRFQEKMRKGNAQMFFWGWLADYPDPENFMFLLYGPNGKVDHGGENAANYHNPKFDALFEQMNALEEGPQKRAIVDQMNEIVRADAPLIYGFHSKSYALSHQWYAPVAVNAMINNGLKYSNIDPELRAKKRMEWNQPTFWPIIIVLIFLIALIIPLAVQFWKREYGVDD